MTKFDLIIESKELYDRNELHKYDLSYDVNEFNESNMKYLKKSNGIIYLANSKLKRKSECEIIDVLIDIVDKCDHIKIIPLVIAIPGNLNKKQSELVKDRFESIIEQKSKRPYEYRYLDTFSKCDCMLNIVSFDNYEYLKDFLEPAYDVATDKNISIIKTKGNNDIKDVFEHYSIARNGNIHNIFEKTLSMKKPNLGTLGFLLQHDGGYIYSKNYLKKIKFSEICYAYNNFSTMHTLFALHDTMIQTLYDRSFFEKITKSGKKIFLIIVIIMIINSDSENVITKIEYIVGNTNVHETYRKILSILQFSKKKLLKMHEKYLIDYEQINIHYPEFETLMDDYLFSPENHELLWVFEQLAQI